MCLLTWGSQIELRLVTPKFQVSSTSVSCTLKNGCKFFFFTTALWSFGFKLYLSRYIQIRYLFYFYFFLCFRFYVFLNFFLCLVFLFIHYSSVTSYLDLVAWFLNSLGELNLFQKFKKKNLIFLGELNLWRSQNSTLIFSIIQHFFIFGEEFIE